METSTRPSRRFETATQPLEPEALNNAIRFALGRIDANLAVFTDRFPAPASQGLVYPTIDNNDWTTAFWTGMLWLAFEATGEGRYRRVAERHIASFRDRLERRVATDTHDLGFLYTLSCIAAYRLTGDTLARDTALAAADLLMTRYFERAGIIQAWGNLADPRERGRMIIDCGMNLPLLYWAAHTGDRPAHFEAAHRHALQSAAYLVRPDASTFHTFYMDTETGAPKRGLTNQGFADDSCWSRGQAWGIYGFTLSHRHTGEAHFLDTAKRLADYFLARLPADAVCYWDLTFTSGPEERDSSAAAIAACGLLELCDWLPDDDPDRTRYQNAALEMVRALDAHYTTRGHPESNGLLQHAVYSKPAQEGVDECCIWGDYFFLEALVRLSRRWTPYW